MIDDLLVDIVGPANLDRGTDIDEDMAHDEALGGSPVRPQAVVRPGSTAEVAAIVKVAASAGVPLTARGALGRGSRVGAFPPTMAWWCRSNG